MTIDHSEEEASRRNFSRRALLLGAGQVAAFSILAGRLYQVQVMEGSRYAPLAEDNRINLKMLIPVRGRILDASGVVLATNTESFRLLVDPSAAPDIKAVLDVLGRIVTIAPDIHEQLTLKAKQGSSAGTIIAASDLTFDQVAEINLLAPQLPGVDTEVAHARRYPLGAAFAHVTGYVGSVDKRALDDDPVLRVAGMKVGKTGVERGMEILLRGEGGVLRTEVDARGRTIRHLAETSAIPGQDVVTTIDVPLQSKVMELLSREKRAAAVVMDAATGEVVALASVPTFDPNEVSGPISHAAWKEIVEAEHQPILNRAISGSYPPGSIFKIVTALAGLEGGYIDTRERIHCGGSYQLADETYRCWKRHGHGAVNLKRAMRESCDVYFYELAKRCGISPIAAMAQRLGFGEASADGLVIERSGVVPDADWKRWHLGHGWSTGDTVLTGIGQGFTLATPLQLAVMTARVATGQMVEARMVRARGGEGQREFRPLSVTQANLDLVRSTLVAVVNESGGTGAAAKPDHDVRVAGKTGTSQVRRLRDVDAEEDDIPWELRDHALFVAYFPAEAPRYVISTVIEHGGGGGTAAAPITRSIIEMLIADDPAERRAPGAEVVAPTRAEGVPNAGAGKG